MHCFRSLGSRLGIWSLASLSFACLLGQFYDLWSMHAFGCLVLPPATLLLAAIAWRAGGEPRTWIVQGAIGGLVAAVVYDLFRLPFVLSGYPLFAVFPRFGQLLLNAGPLDFGPAVQLTGWAYHFSNGAALGIMFLAMVQRPSPRLLFWGAVAWALVVECLLLITPYYAFFQLKLDPSAFLGLTLSAHLVFGCALGTWMSKRVQQAIGTST